MLAVNNRADFWRQLDKLTATCDLAIDRPQGSTHPRHPSLAYPLDYGYLVGTRSGDGEGIDVWIGSLPHRSVTAIICTVDLQQGDAELKLLLGCTPQEARQVLETHNVGSQSGILVERIAPRVGQECQPRCAESQEEHG